MSLTGVRSVAGKDLVPVGPGLLAYSPVHVFAAGDGFKVELLVVAEPATGDRRVGRFVCVELGVRQSSPGTPITGEVLRSVAVAELTKEAGRHVVELEDPGTGRVAYRLLDAETLNDIRRDGPSKATLTWVAYIWRLAAILGDAPTRAVEDKLGIPRSTAGRWVALARDRGLLGPAAGPGKVAG